MNARQRRLFEEAQKKNPNVKIPTASSEPLGELTEEDLALLKQGVGDKSGRPSSQSAAGGSEGSEEIPQDPQTGAIMTYFGEKGFGFLRPDSGGKDIFFHVSRLQDGDATELVPGKRIAYDLGMDRNGKIAASSIRFLPAEEAPKTPEA